MAPQPPVPTAPVPVVSAWASKINWTQAVAAFAMITDGLVYWRQGRHGRRAAGGLPPSSPSASAAMSRPGS